MTATPAKAGGQDPAYRPSRSTKPRYCQRGFRTMRKPGRKSPYGVAGPARSVPVSVGWPWMSLVYSRDVTWASRLGELSVTFADCFKRVKSRCPKRSKGIG